jgi:(p)ppGpp synthase/HD superfamily hydrolase
VLGRRRLPNLVARLPRTRAALEYAEQQHSGQRRSSDGAPFIQHPLEVGWLLYRAGMPDHVIAAGVLHDVLEKTDVTVTELTARFGPAATRLVEAVSEDDTIRGYRQRKSALRQQVAAAGPEALMILAADKVSKVRELHAAIATARRRHTPVETSLLPPRRVAHLRQCHAMLEQTLGDAPLVETLGGELVTLDRDLATLTEAKAAA